MHTTKAFNLLDEPWLPVLDHAGNRKRVTLKEIFQQAPEIRELRADSPLVTVSLHRLLLAILYRTCPPKSIKDWGELWQNGFPESTILNYLDSHHDGFYLVHPDRPWLQRAELREKDSKDDTPITKLIIGAAAKNNKQLFDHSLDEEPRRVPPEDAPGLLLCAHHWSLGGGRASYGRPNFLHGTLVGSAQVILAGENLFQTLVLSLVPANGLKSEPHRISVGDSRDQCPWEGKTDEEFLGIAKWLLWPSRWLLLRPEFTDNQLQGFQKVAFTSGDPLPAIADPKNGVFFDPWSSVTKTEKYGYGRIGISEDTALWRNFDSIFDTFNLTKRNQNAPARPLQTIEQAVSRDILPEGFQLRPLVFGMANDQAKVILWRESEFRLPAKFYSEVAGPSLFASSSRAIQVAKECYKALSEELHNFASNALKSDSMQADREAVRKLRDRLIRQHDFWGSLEIDFHHFLQTVSEMPEELAEHAWQQAVRRNVENSFNAAMSVYPVASARVMQARVKAEGIFSSKLNAIIPKETVSNATEPSVG